MSVRNVRLALLGAVAAATVFAAVLALPRPVQAEASSTTTNEQIPITLVVFVPCANDGAGETVVLSGTLHVLTHITVSDSGNLVVKQHFQPQGISGEGLDTGDTYHATGVTQETFTLRPGGTFEDTFVNNFRMIGQGPGNNFLVHQTIHVTVNANGEVTSTVDNTSVECK